MDTALQQVLASKHLDFQELTAGDAFWSRSLVHDTSSSETENRVKLMFQKELKTHADI